MLRLNEYKVMWILVFFDLPTETPKQRKVAAEFRKRIMADGFTMFQLSVYTRHCASLENAMVHRRRVRNLIPKQGKVCMLTITDKQFSEIELFISAKAEKPQTGPIQLELF